MGFGYWTFGSVNGVKNCPGVYRWIKWIDVSVALARYKDMNDFKKHVKTVRTV